ncbi:MAG: VWA domain-containing protein [Clostridiales bacterium]|nr:VWA domain-containing protein [Clostridiales bacterium]
MGKKLRSLISIILTAVMVVVAVPIMSVPVDATEEYNSKINGQDYEPSERYTILVLDVSGPEEFFINNNTETYISDSSIEDVKSSAKKFLDAANTSLSHNQIAIVTYAEEAEIVSDFTDDISALINKLDDIQEKTKEARSIEAGLVCAKDLMDKVTADNAIKNILLCTTGLTSCGNYSYSGQYNKNTVASTWQNIDTRVKLYAYANVAIDAANSLKETDTAIYVIGLFNPIEASIPDKSTLNNVKEFFRLTAHDLASSESTFYAVENVEDLDFTFGELQDDLIGSGTVRIYNDSDSNPENAPKDTAESFDKKTRPAPSLGLYGYYEDVLWGPELFEQPSTQLESSSTLHSDTTTYNLAMLSGCLCTVATKPDYLLQAYLDLGFKDEDIYFYSYKDHSHNRPNATRNGKKFADDADLAFSIASRTMTINGVDSDVLVIVARGTTSNAEFVMDANMSANKEFYNYIAWDWNWEFEEDIFAGLADYYNDHPDIGKRPLKILVTGHSLGGGAANLVAAKFDMEAGKDYLFCKNISKDDVYAFTFGALNSIIKKMWNDKPVDTPVKGFDNIVNIFNELDTFGPEGDALFNIKPANGDQSFYNKFGRFYTFRSDMDGPVKHFANSRTHQIVGYVYAVKTGMLHTTSIDFTKKEIRVIIRCPVDVTVMHGEDIVCQIVSDEIVSIDSSITAYVEDSSKTLIIPHDSDYQIYITATNSGTMNYVIQDLDITSNSSASFVDIALETDKTFLCELTPDTNIDKVDLFVTDKDGNIIAKITGDGQEVDPNAVTATPTPTPTPSPTPTAAPTPVPISYTVVSEDIVWKNGSFADLDIVVERSEDNESSLNHFTDVKVNGKTLDKDTEYEVSDSLKITLKNKYLRTLEAGKQTVLIEFDDGEVSAQITIEERGSMGITTIIGIALAAVVVLALLLVAAFVIFKKLKI